jgi:hypothetical protein
MRSMAGVTIWSQCIASTASLSMDAFLVDLADIIMTFFTADLGQFGRVFILGIRILMTGYAFLLTMNGLRQDIRIHVYRAIIRFPGEIRITMAFETILIVHGQGIVAVHGQGKQNNEKETGPNLYLFPGSGFHVSLPVSLMNVMLF